MVDPDLFMRLQDLYRYNVHLFEEQNSGLFVEKVVRLTEDDIEKAIGYGGLIDQRYIDQHYINFTINPQPTELMVGYIKRVVISPDISWEVKR